MPGRESMGEAFWERTIRQQQRSGLSVSLFCEQQGLSANTFYRWKQRLTEDSGFQQVVVQDVASIASPAIEIELTDGVKVRCPSGFAADDLSQVLEALRGSPC